MTVAGSPWLPPFPPDRRTPKRTETLHAFCNEDPHRCAARGRDRVWIHVSRRAASRRTTQSPARSVALHAGATESVVVRAALVPHRPDSGGGVRRRARASAHGQRAVAA